MLPRYKGERHGEVRIDIGSKEHKFRGEFFEKKYREVYDAGKFLRWDASDKTWNKHIKRLKEILDSDTAKNAKILRICIMCHGGKSGWLGIKDGGGTIRSGLRPTDDDLDKADRPLKRFEDFVNVIKEFMDKNKDVKVYVHGIPCYGAFFIPNSYAKCIGAGKEAFPISKLMLQYLVDEYGRFVPTYIPTIYSVMQRFLGDSSNRVFCSQVLPGAGISRKIRSIKNYTKLLDSNKDNPSSIYIEKMHIVDGGKYGNEMDNFLCQCRYFPNIKNQKKQTVLDIMRGIRKNVDRWKDIILIGAEECNIYFPLSEYDHNTFCEVFTNKDERPIKKLRERFKKFYGSDARKRKTNFINEARTNLDKVAMEKAKRRREPICCF